MTLTLGFQGQLFNIRILGMWRSIDMEWKICELDAMLDEQWACSWATVHMQVIGRCVKLLHFPTPWPMNVLPIH